MIIEVTIIIVMVVPKSTTIFIIVYAFFRLKTWYAYNNLIFVAIARTVAKRILSIVYS